MGVFGVIIGVGLAAYAGLNLFAGIAAGSWPTVEGIILSSEVRASDRNVWAQVRYRYEVGTVQYEGDRVRFGPMPGGNQRRASAVVSRYAAGTRVRVYVDPKQPANAVLETGVATANVVMFSIGLVVLLLGLVGIIRTSTDAADAPSQIDVEPSTSGPPPHIRRIIVGALVFGFLFIAAGVGYMALTILRQPNTPPNDDALPSRPFSISSLGARRPVEGTFDGTVSADASTVNVVLQRVVLHATDQLGSDYVPQYLRAVLALRTAGQETWQERGESDPLPLEHRLTSGDSLVLAGEFLRIDRRAKLSLQNLELAFEIGLRPDTADKVTRWVYAFGASGSLDPSRSLGAQR